MCQLIYDKGGKNIQWRKDSLFNKWWWQNWTATCKRIKLGYFLTLYTKINSKWTKDLNIRPDIIKLLERNISIALSDINNSNIFFDPPQRAIKIKKKKQMDLIKSLFTAKEIWTKWQASEWEKILANKATDKGFISKLYKLLMKLNVKKKSIKNWMEGINWYFLKVISYLLFQFGPCLLPHHKKTFQKSFTWIIFLYILFDPEVLPA